MRERSYIRCIDRHDRPKKNGEIYALRFARKLKCRSISIEGERPLDRRHRNGDLIIADQKPPFYIAVTCAVNQLYRSVAERYRRHYVDNLGRLDPGKIFNCSDFLQLPKNKTKGLFLNVPEILQPVHKSLGADTVLTS